MEGDIHRRFIVRQFIVRLIDGRDRQRFLANDERRGQAHT